jgi:pimeloyl-ACP methyl ester carboxylesterase
MGREMKTKITLILTVILIFSANIWAQAAPSKGKNPIIVIPGIMGSKLVNQKTGEVVWVRLSEAKADDLRLPVSTNLLANRDDLVATDIVDRYKIVKFLPGISVYSDLTDFLEKKAGYKRGNWDIPLSTDDQDTYYIFAYDWRRDNVESARLLIQKIEKLKAKLKKPDIKFDILAHSMGGLITRYAAMYGTADLSENPKPTWAGAKHFEKVFLLGTPNEGSMNALETLNDGYSIEAPVAGRIRPGYLNREVAFTIPSIYQLLPHGKSAKFYDEFLKPMELNIYDPATWRKYGWTITANKEFQEKTSKTQKAVAEKYFETVLNRARLFHRALDIKTVIPKSLALYVYGSDCKRTLDGAVVYFDTEKGNWKTLTDGDSFKTGKGDKVDGKLVKDTIFAKGDGTVALSSLLGETTSLSNGRDLFFDKPESPNRMIICEEHTSIPSNKKIQELFTTILATSLAN